MNIMTDSQVSQELVVSASIKKMGYYGHWWSRVTIDVEIPFDINDPSRSIYYNAWQTSHNLPVDSPFHKEIEMVKNEIRLDEMMLSDFRGTTRVSFFGNTYKNESDIQDLLTYIFCNNIIFKTK